MIIYHSVAAKNTSFVRFASGWYGGEGKETIFNTSSGEYASSGDDDISLSSPFEDDLKLDDTKGGQQQHGDSIPSLELRLEIESQQEMLDALSGFDDDGGDAVPVVGKSIVHQGKNAVVRRGSTIGCASLLSTSCSDISVSSTAEKVLSYPRHRCPSINGSVASVVKPVARYSTRGGANVSEARTSDTASIARRPPRPLLHKKDVSLLIKASGSIKLLLMGAIMMANLILILVVAGKAIAGSITQSLTLRDYEFERQLAKIDIKEVDLLAELLTSHKLNGNEAAAAEVERKLMDAAKFKVGDVVEQIYNAYSMKSRMLYPFVVEEITFAHNSEEEDSSIPEMHYTQEWSDCGGIRYTVVRLVDGFRMRQIPERSLRTYLPYREDANALCSIGGNGPSAQKFAPCTVGMYVVNEEGTEATEARYRVRIRGEEEDRTLSMDKLQRFAGR